MDKGSARWRWRDANLSHRAVAEKAGGFKISKTRGWEQQRFNVYGLDGGDNEKNRHVIVLMNRTTPVA